MVAEIFGRKVLHRQSAWSVHFQSCAACLDGEPTVRRRYSRPQWRSRWRQKHIQGIVLFIMKVISQLKLVCETRKRLQGIIGDISKIKLCRANPFWLAVTVKQLFRMKQTKVIFFRALGAIFVWRRLQYAWEFA